MKSFCCFALTVLLGFFVLTITGCEILLTEITKATTDDTQFPKLQHNIKEDGISVSGSDMERVSSVRIEFSFPSDVSVAIGTPDSGGSWSISSVKTENGLNVILTSLTQYRFFFFTLRLDDTSIPGTHHFTLERIVATQGGKDLVIELEKEFTLQKSAPVFTLRKTGDGKIAVHGEDIAGLKRLAFNFGADVKPLSFLTDDAVWSNISVHYLEGFGTVTISRPEKLRVTEAVLLTIGFEGPGPHVFKLTSVLFVYQTGTFVRSFESTFGPPLSVELP